MTRAENLRRALEIAQETPSPVVAGDALALLPGILDSILEDTIPCVFPTHAVYQFAPEDPHRLYALLVERSALRDVVVRIGMEPSEAGRSVLSISIYRHGYGSNVWQTAITTVHGSPGTPIRCVTRRDALRQARVAREIFGAGKIEVPRKWARNSLRHRLN